MLNIAKWIYFFMVIKTHRNIRLFEISVEIFAERDGTNNDLANSVLADTENSSGAETIESKKLNYRD